MRQNTKARAAPGFFHVFPCTGDYATIRKTKDKAMHDLRTTSHDYEWHPKYFGIVVGIF